MKISSKEIFKKFAVWQDYMADSWERGEKMVNFVERSEQAVSSRPGTEVLTFNVILPLLRTLQSRSKNIDLSLCLLSKCDEAQEEKTFRQLVHNIMLNDRNREAFAANLDKVYSFGQGVMHVKTKLENEETLNEVIEIENIEDVTTTFFDKYASDPTFTTGEFCGRTFKIDAKKVRKYYRNIRNETLEKVCEVADFWVKEKVPATYIRLATGEYKREDLIDPLKDMELQNEKPIKSFRTAFHYYRVIKGSEVFLAKKKDLDYACLPLIYNPGGTIWNQEDRKYESFPFGYHLQDPQILLNYVGTTITAMLKSTHADRWIFKSEHLKSAEAQKAADEINTREGGLVFTGETQTIRRELPQQIPPELGQLFISLQQAIRGMSNNYFAENADEIKSLSGVAFDKLFARMDMSQNSVILDHIKAVNRAGEVIRQQIPLYYFQERTICVSKEDGTQQIVKINEPYPQPDGSVLKKNNIAQLSNKYRYTIKAAASKRLQDQNLQMELEKLYTFFPQAVGLTIDIYARSLDIPAADVLAKRLGINIPEALKKYADGDITEAQFQQFQQQQQMAQQRAMQQNPESQYMQARAHNETMKPGIEMYKAQTGRMKEVGMTTNKHIESISDAAKVAMDTGHKEQQQRIDLILELIKHLPNLAKKELESRED